MKPLGVIRRIDDLGRVVIPKEIRQRFRIREGDPLEIFVEKEAITMKKYEQKNELDWFGFEEYFATKHAQFSSEDADSFLKCLSQLKKIVNEVEEK